MMEQLRQQHPFDRPLGEPRRNPKINKSLIEVAHPEGLKFEVHEEHSQQFPENQLNPAGGAMEVVRAVPEKRKKKFSDHLNAVCAFFKVVFVCWYNVVEFAIEILLSKWTWNVLMVVTHVVVDVFFHLVLAVSAIMVTLIINVDNIYMKVQEDHRIEANLKSTGDVNNRLVENEPELFKVRT